MTGSSSGRSGRSSPRRRAGPVITISRTVSGRRAKGLRLTPVCTAPSIGGFIFFGEGGDLQPGKESRADDEITTSITGPIRFLTEPRGLSPSAMLLNFGRRMVKDEADVSPVREGTSLGGEKQNLNSEISCIDRGSVRVGGRRFRVEGNIV